MHTLPEENCSIIHTAPNSFCHGDGHIYGNHYRSLSGSCFKLSWYFLHNLEVFSKDLAHLDARPLPFSAWAGGRGFDSEVDVEAAKGVPYTQSCQAVI
jgi:hypothetical protein